MPERTDGIGQCNTKSTLLMPLLRAVGSPCRSQGFTIDKRLQKGAITGLAYWLPPQRIDHAMNRNVTRIRGSRGDLGRRRHHAQRCHR